MRKAVIVIDNCRACPYSGPPYHEGEEGRPNSGFCWEARQTYLTDNPEVAHFCPYAVDSDDEVLKQNVLRLAKHHKATCPGEECNISLHMLAVVLKRAGIKITEEENRSFL